MLNTIINEVKCENEYGDILDSVIIAAEMISSYCKHLKYKKTIYLITDGNGKINNEDTEQNYQIASKIDELGILLNIIIINLNEENDNDNNEDTRNVSEIKKKNELFLKEFAENSKGEIWSVNEVIEILNSFRAKSVRPVTLLRAPISIGKEPYPFIDISCYVYSKTMEVKLPSAKKYSTVAESASEVIEKTYDVDMERVYRLKKDTLADLENGNSNTEVNPEHIVKGYRYGQSIIPFNSIDEEQLMLKNIKGMTILGFIPKNKLRREWLMSNVYKIIAEPSNIDSGQALSALVKAMVINEVVAIMKYVRIANSAPKIGVLLPVIKGDYDCFYWCQLPYNDDIRNFYFPSFEDILAPKNTSKSKIDTKKRSTEEIMETFENFINSKDLMGESEDDELYKPKNTFNTSYQYLYQCILERALNPNDPLPEKKKRLFDMINPNPDIERKSKKAALKIKEMFEIKMVDTSSQKKQKFGEAATNEISNLIKDIKNEDGTSNPAFKTEEELKNLSLKNVISTGVKEIRSMDPVSDFKAMVNQRETDLIEEAIKQMTKMIYTLISSSFTSQSYEKIINSIVVLREACQKEDEGQVFNEFLRELKRELNIPDLNPSIYSHKDFWQCIVDKQINLILSEDGKEGADQEEVDKFLNSEEKKNTQNNEENANVDIGVSEDIDDLFDMLE